MDHIWAITEWVGTNGPILAGVFVALGSASVAVSKLTSTTKDDEVAEEVSKVGSWLSRLFGRKCGPQ